MEIGGDVSAGRNHPGRGLPLGGGGQDDRGPASKGPEEGVGGRCRKKPSQRTLRQGKQTLHQLKQHGASLTNIEITEQNIKAFSAVAKKYDIDYALKKDPQTEPPALLCVLQGEGQVLRGTERSLTDGFSRFMLHYRFQAEFCNPASGNEKGNVENKVGYSRRNAFVPVPTITSFEKFNEEYLWGWCEKDAQRDHYIHKIPIRELWQADADALLNLPDYPFSVFRYSTLTVSKTGFVVIDTNRYGLSPALAGEVVQAKIFFDHIEFFHDHHAVGTFRRSYKQNDEIYDWTQYVSTLCKKPRAMENTRFFHQMPQQWQTYLASTQGKERKNALQLLSEIVNDGNADLCDDALELAAQNGRTDTDSLRQCYYMVAKKEYRPDPLQLTSGPMLNYNPNLSIYDGLMGGDAHG